MSEPKVIKFQKLAVVPDPKQATAGSAGYDLGLPQSETLDPRRITRINLGIAVQIPEGYVGLLKPRSSTAKKYGLTMVSSGVIDSDYRGELSVEVTAHHRRTLQVLDEGEKVFQLVVVPCLHAKVNVVKRLPQTKRGNGGFGSTDEE